jgi:hypothetical protein
MEGQSNLAQITDTSYAPRSLSRGHERRQNQRAQNANYRNHDQEFQNRQAATATEQAAVHVRLRPYEQPMMCKKAQKK